MNPTFNKQNYHGATNAGLPVKPKWKYDGGDSEHFDKLQKQARDILSLHGLAQTLKKSRGKPMRKNYGAKKSESIYK